MMFLEQSAKFTDFDYSRVTLHFNEYIKFSRVICRRNTFYFFVETHLSIFIGLPNKLESGTDSSGPFGSL